MKFSNRVLFIFIFLFSLSFVLGQETGLLTSDNSLDVTSQLAISNFSQLKEVEFEGYIVEFSEVPLVKYRAEVELVAKKNQEYIENSAKLNPRSLYLKAFGIVPSKVAGLVKNQNDLLNKQHSEIKNRILVKLSSTNKAVTNQEKKVGREFKDLVNGIVLNISVEEAREIETIKGVKKVWRNQKVEINLMDSVPQIQDGILAGKLDIDGNDCTVSGKECLTGENVTIAIIDTGVDYTHSDLGGCFGETCKVIGGYDFINDDADPMDDHGHGTHVAATAAGNGVLNGVAPGAKIRAYKVLDGGGGGSWEHVIAGIERAVIDGADILSLSLGGGGNPDDLVSQAIDNAVLNGSVAVIAAGNSGPGEQTIGSPGTARNAITVGAIDEQNWIAYFSSVGPVIWTDLEGNENAIIKPDVVAPGVNICAAQWENAWESQECLDNQHTSISGTSMATPHVAGAVALVKQAHPTWTPEEIKSVLKNTATDLQYSFAKQGVGKVNVSKAVGFSGVPFVVKFSSMNYLARGRIDIIGTVIGQNMSKYGVYYSYDEDTWNLICAGTNEVENEVLCSDFDTTSINQGKIILKVVAQDNNSNHLFSNYALIKLNNFKITQVGDTGNYISNKKQPIFGEIYLSNYSSYGIEYKNNNDVWIELCRISKSGEIFGELCAPDFTSLHSERYSVRLVLYTADLAIYGDEEFEFAVVRDLMEGWPVKELCHGANTMLTSGEEENEIKILSATAVACGPGGSEGGIINIYDYSSNLSQIRELYKDGEYVTDAGEVSWSFFSMAHEGISLSLPMLLGIVDYQGNFLGPWPQHNLPQLYSLGFSLITEDNVFNFMRDYFEGDDVYLQGLNFSDEGNALEGFPIKIERYSDFKYWALATQKVLIKGNGEDYLGVMVAYYDSLDEGRNGKLFFDIYSASNGSRIKRTLLHESFGGLIQYNGWAFASGDLNNNGNSEIAVGYMVLNLTKFYVDEYDIEAYNSYLKILDFTGEVISEPFEIQGYTLKNIRIGQFGRQNPEIVFELEDTWPTTSLGQRIIGMNYSGDILFDINIGDYTKLIAGISIGDVSGDGFSDVLVSYRPRWWSRLPSGINVYNREGAMIKELIMPTFGEAEQLEYGSDPLLIDFDEDGKVEIILKTLHLQKNLAGAWQSNIFVFKTGALYDESNMDWPQFQHDAQHTGCYDCKDTLPAPSANGFEIRFEKVPGFVYYNLFLEVRNLKNVNISEIFRVNGTGSISWDNDLEFLFNGTNGSISDLKAKQTINEQGKEFIEAHKDNISLLYNNSVLSTYGINLGCIIDGVCENQYGENSSSCASDCGPVVPTGCIDYDFGINLTVASYVEDENQKYEDYCASENRVTEGYCGLNIWQFKKVAKTTTKECKYMCEDGRCVEQEDQPNWESCMDSDRDNKLDVFGSVNLRGEVYDDSCEENGKSVRQYYCDEGKLRNFVRACSNGQSCSDGICN